MFLCWGDALNRVFDENVREHNPSFAQKVVVPGGNIGLRWESGIKVLRSYDEIERHRL